MIQALYTNELHTAVVVVLAAGDSLGTMSGPATIALTWPAPGNAEADALAATVEAGTATIAAYEPPAPAVPAIISDWQFAQALATAGTIAEDEALSWAARGDLPARLSAAIARLPEDQQFPARMLLSSATTYERDHPLVARLGAALGYDAAALDTLWRAAAAL